MGARSAISALAIAAILTSFTVPAAAGVVALGLKGGLSAATLHGDLLLSNGRRFGVAGGLGLVLGAGRVSLQPEVLFVMKGTSLGEVDFTDAVGNPIGTATVRETVDYIEFPVLARIALPGAGAFSPYLLAGPALGVRVSQKLTISGALDVSTGVDQFRAADVGLAFGPGLELGRGHVRGTLEARYTMGLTPASEAAYSDTARNGALLVMAGLVLRP